MPEDLFEFSRKAQIDQESPLANRMRPRTLDEYVGQDHIIGKGRLLRRAIEADHLSSVIFYGPPGTGKTTLAMVIANSTKSHFITLNAVLAGVKEIREGIADAIERRNLYNQRTTLFVDEVHRWNKSQQDALLPHVEKGTILLIGATTENPYFEVNKALVSRSRVFQLKPLTDEDLYEIADQALNDPERGYGNRPLVAEAEAVDHLVNVANGDARTLLNALELAVETTEPLPDGKIHLSLAVAEESIQKRAVLYDKDGDSHYDTISAFIKSLRGSDPDAALYWLAKMIYAGEDPRFIFRRMGIFTGEDIGMADPQAAVVVNSCWQLYERIGLPEGQFPLAQAALYLATAPKSNSVFAYFDATKVVKEEKEGEVPNHLKDSNRDSKGFGHGKGYLYPHAYQSHWVAQQYLPNGLQGRLFYQPSDQGFEKEIQVDVARKREAQLAAMLAGGTDDISVDDGEILTFSPVNRQESRWLERTVSGYGEALAALRERVFLLAKIQRHHLVLINQDRDGLFSWESVRQAPEGGVWAVVPQADRRQLLASQANQLSDLVRPQFVEGLDAVSSDIHFDRLFLYNQFSTLKMSHSQIRDLKDMLSVSGIGIVIQQIPRYGQRLSQLLDDALEADWIEIIHAVEDEIYTDPDNPRVSWDENDLAERLKADGWTPHRFELFEFKQTKRIDHGTIIRWLGEEISDQLPKNRLIQGLSQKGLAFDALKALQKESQRYLLNRSVPWVNKIGIWVVSAGVKNEPAL